MDEDLAKNDLVARFMETTAIHDVNYAIETLEQTNWQVDDAICIALNTQQNEMESSTTAADGNSPPGSLADVPDESPILSSVDLMPPPPTIPIHSVNRRENGTSTRSQNILRICVNLPSLHGSAPITECIRIPDSDCVRDIKRMLIEKCSANLLLALTSVRSDVGETPMDECFVLDGFPGYSTLVEEKTILRTMHLPNHFTLSLTLLPAPQRATSYLQSHLSIDEAAIVSPIELHFALSPEDPYYKESNAHFLLSLQPSSKLAQVCRNIATKSRIPFNRQIYSLSDLSSFESEATKSKLETLTVALNSICTSAESSYADFTLSDLNLTAGMIIHFNLLTNAPTEGQSSSPPPSRKSSTSSRRVRSAASEFDEDEDYEDEDDDYVYGDEDDIAFDTERLADEKAPSHPNSQKDPLIDEHYCMEDPSAAITRLSENFIMRYVVDDAMMPPMAVCSFDEIIQRTINQQKLSNRKLLFVYLHCNRSISCHLFCSKILCSQGFHTFMEGHGFELWPWDVTIPLAQERLMGWLHARLPPLALHVESCRENSYPLLLVLGKIAGQVELLATVTGTGHVDATAMPLSGLHSEFPILGTHNLSDGPVSLAGASSSQSTSQAVLDPDTVVAQLIQAYENYQMRLAPERQKELESEARLNVLREQERAYQESLEQDQAKARIRAQELEDQRRRDHLEQLHREREEQEARDRRQQKLLEVPMEPPEANSDAGRQFIQNNPLGGRGIATLRFRLPSGMENTPSGVNGRNLIRRFAGVHRLHHVLAYIESLGFPTENFKLLTTYPRKDLTAQNAEDMLADLKLVPQETLMIEER